MEIRHLLSWACVLFPIISQLWISPMETTTVGEEKTMYDNVNDDGDDDDDDDDEDDDDFDVVDDDDGDDT